MMNDFSNQMGQLARKHGESMRQQAQDRAKQRKEEYLGARVSKALRERVSQHAETLDIPVSLLIRQVLEKAFPAPKPSPEPALNALQPSVSENGTANAQIVQPAHLTASEAAPASDLLASVIAWDSVQLNKPMPCRLCQTYLPKGDDVMLGVLMDSPERPILCKECQSNL